jgi:hypothetical protein
MKFTHSHTDLDNNVQETITIETCQHITLNEALESFERFLKAVGYSFEGTITIEEDELPSSDDFDEDCNIDGDDVVLQYEESLEGFDEEVKPNDWPFPKNSKP